MTFTAAIVGRPNVGKSTLFNRLIGKKLALVDDTPGVTRDRREGDATLGRLEFKVVDTAGYEDAAVATLAGRMREQTLEAIRLADIVFFVIDARTGIVPMDIHFAELLRKQNKPVVLIANKAEGKEGAQRALEAYSLGFGEPLPLSAEHNEGFVHLRDVLEEAFPELPENLEDFDNDNEEAEGDDDLIFPTEDDPKNDILRLAIVGRPNAGKSTLVNRLIGEERMLTGPEAGITRDTITIDWSWRGLKVKLFDTAGIRRRARVQEKLEKLSVADALRAVRFAQVVVLLIDAESPFDKQDLQLADMVIKEGRVLIVAINKWDTVEQGETRRKQLQEDLDQWLPQVKGMKIVTLSGLTGKGAERLLDEALKLRDTWSRRTPTSGLNRWFTSAIGKNPPPAVGGRRLKMNYVTQVTTRPPTFVVFGTRPDAVPESYIRYLINSLREGFELHGVPIRLSMRGKVNPYEGKKKKR